MLQGIQIDFLVLGVIPLYCHCFRNVQYDKFITKEPIATTAEGYAPDPNGVNTPARDVII
jgi:hypothetical protein